MGIGKYASLVCNYFNITKIQLKDKSRKYSEARKWLYYICKVNGIGEAKIATYIKRNRSTINKVFSNLNKRVDKHSSYNNIKTKLLSETEIN